MNRWLPLAAWIGAVILAALFWSTDLLAGGDNRVENERAQNGISSFFRAARTNEIDYRANFKSQDLRENLALVTESLASGGGRFVRLADGRLDRALPARPDGLGMLNLIVVAADHGARAYGAEDIPLRTYEIPMMIWSPKHIAYYQTAYETFEGRRYLPSAAAGEPAVAAEAET